MPARRACVIALPDRTTGWAKLVRRQQDDAREERGRIINRVLPATGALAAALYLLAGPRGAVVLELRERFWIDPFG